MGSECTRRYLHYLRSQVNIPDTIRKAIRIELEQCFRLLFESLDEQGALRDSPELTAADTDPSDIDAGHAKHEEPLPSSPSTSGANSSLYVPRGTKQHANVINAAERAAIKRAIACSSSTVPDDLFERARANIHKLITDGPVARFHRGTNVSEGNGGDLRKAGVFSRVSDVWCCGV